MLILLGLVAILILGAMFANNDSDSMSFMGMMAVIISGMLLLFMLILLPISRMETDTFILEIDATRATYAAARNNGNSIESAAIQVDIAKLNRRLVILQYYNNTCFDIWHKDTIDSVEPIK